jgi:prevent-host-death family protein
MSDSHTVTATEAKNRLGLMLERARLGPVFIEKAGRRHSVLLSAERYEALIAPREPAVDTIDPGQRFYELHREWVDGMNALVEQAGIPGEEFRTW